MHGEGMVRRLAMVAGLAGCGRAVADEPGPGQCKNSFDNPFFNPHFQEISTCCVSGDKSQPLIWCARFAFLSISPCGSAAQHHARGPVRRANGCAQNAYVDTPCDDGCGGTPVVGAKYALCCTRECCAAARPHAWRVSGVRVASSRRPSALGAAGRGAVSLRVAAGPRHGDGGRFWMGLAHGCAQHQRPGRHPHGRAGGHLNLTFPQFHANHSGGRHSKTPRSRATCRCAASPMWICCCCSAAGTLGTCSRR